MDPRLLFKINNFVCLMAMACIAATIFGSRIKGTAKMVVIIGLALLVVICAIANVLLAMAL